MVDINEPDPACCVLKLMVLAIGSEIDIRPLAYCIVDELCAASAAKGDGGDFLF
jgi:hypothetical protein